jgi:hypothetical protein
MAAEEVYMDIPQVQDISKKFQTFGDVLDGIGKAIEAIALVMHALAWVSLGCTEAIARYLDQIKPNFTKAAEKMRELSTDVNDAVKSYQNGDLTGSRRFC